MNKAGGKKKQNIILLGISIISRPLTSDTFITPANKKIENCVSPQECVVRYWLDKIPEDEDITIVSLCSSQTKEANRKVTIPDKKIANYINSHWENEIFTPIYRKTKDDQEDVSDLEQTETSIHVDGATPRKSEKKVPHKYNSSHTFNLTFGRKLLGVQENPGFITIKSNSSINLGDKNQIKQESKDNINEIPEVNTKQKKQETDSNRYTMNISAYDFFQGQIERCQERKNRDINYVVINQNRIAAAIGEVTAELRNLYKDNPDSCLYVDTHGGFRDISQMLNAVLSLLKHENYKGAGTSVNIVPQEVMGVHYGNEQNGTPNEIVDQMQSFEIFDFITGINDFAYYGNAEILKEYYERHNGQEATTQKITNAMEQISMGTQICSPTLYTVGLEKLRKLLKSPAEDDLFKIFKENIQADYGVILDDNIDDDTRNFEIIQRCMNKHLYQQALTFAESQMPKYFCNKIVEIINGPQKKENYNSDREKYKCSYKEFENQLIDNLVFQLENDKYLAWKDNDEKENKDERVLLKSLEEKRTCDDLIEKVSKLKRKNDRYLAWINVKDKQDRDLYQISCFLEPRFLTTPPKYKQFHELLLIHAILKDQRNTVNHGGEDNEGDVESLKLLMDRYIMLVKELTVK